MARPSKKELEEFKRLVSNYRPHDIRTGAPLPNIPPEKGFAGFKIENGKLITL